MILKKVLSVFGLVFFLSIVCLSLNAQTTASEKMVYSFFSKPKKIKWIEHYRGKFDGANDIAMTLAYDGKSCKGLLVYSKSGELLRLDGTLKGNELRLLEVDQNGIISGEYEGQIEGKNMLLTWSNIDNTLGSDAFLIQVQKEELNSKPEVNQQWVSYYEGNIFGSKVDLFLQHDGKNVLSGIAYFFDENRSYNLVGEIFDFDNLDITIKNDQNKLKGKLQGVFKDGNEIAANFYKSGHRTPTNFLIRRTMKIDCIEYADYFMSYDISFPKTSNLSFNRWMEELATQWLNNCRKQAFEFRGMNLEKKPELRSAVRACAWSDVDFFDDQLISGVLTFENTWTDGFEGEPFNYDFKKGKKITLKDIFKEGSDISAIIANQLNEEISQHLFYKDYEFRNWLSKQDFPYFLIHKDGLAFCTSFNSIYGRQKVKISYEKLKPYFKENNVLDYLINRSYEGSTSNF